MIVYKYVKLDGLDIIENLRIKVSNPKDFNDPFEFIPSVLDVPLKQADDMVFNNEEYLKRLYDYAISIDQTNKSFELFVEEIRSSNGRVRILESLLIVAESLRIKCEELKAKSDEMILVSCFSGEDIERSQEVLMWSHYTDGHKGLRIAFDTDVLNIEGSSFEEIKYQANRVQLNPIDHFIGNRTRFEDVFNEVIVSKASNWSYERECRWLVPSNKCQRYKKNSFVYINPKAIVEVVCGQRCSLKQILLIKSLVRSKLSNEVKVKRSEIDAYEFKLDRARLIEVLEMTLKEGE